MVLQYLELLCNKAIITYKETRERLVTEVKYPDVNF